jgi:hypothetical protein
VELHEFGIGDQCSGAGRHAETFAASLDGIGGDGVKRAEAAGRQDHLLRME